MVLIQPCLGLQTAALYPLYYEFAIVGSDTWRAEMDVERMQKGFSEVCVEEE